jgi:hypothetical protein
MQYYIHAEVFGQKISREMAKKTVDFNKSGVAKLADDKGFCTGFEGTEARPITPVSPSG